VQAGREGTPQRRAILVGSVLEKEER
jgi:hypothetical protein